MSDTIASDADRGTDFKTLDPVETVHVDLNAVYDTAELCAARTECLQRQARAIGRDFSRGVDGSHPRGIARQPDTDPENVTRVGPSVTLSIANHSDKRKQMFHQMAAYHAERFRRHVENVRRIADTEIHPTE